MTEEWRTAVYDGEVYEGLYKVSNLGRILSLNYRNTGKAELLNPGKDKDGYLQVVLSKNRETKTCKVHRLIAETFLPNPEGKPCVNHKIEGDEGKKINMVIFNEDGTINKEKTTIEWVTVKENSNYGTRNKRVSEAQRGEKNHMFGKHHSEEARKKISRVHKGKPKSVETKRKMSESAKKRFMLKKMQPDGCLPLF